MLKDKRYSTLTARLAVILIIGTAFAAMITSALRADERSDVNSDPGAFMPVLLSDAGGVTATPTIPSQGSPTPTATLESTAAPSATPTATATLTSTATTTPTSTPTGTPTATPTATDTPTDTSTPTATATTDIESTPTPTSTPTITPTDTPTDTPTNTPTDTPTPTVTPTLPPGEELLVFDWNKPVTEADGGFAVDIPPIANGDWTKPINFAEGTLYFRAEIRSQPVPQDEMRLGFCFWQEVAENCAGSPVPGRKGTVVTWERPVKDMFKVNGISIDWSKARRRNGFAVRNRNNNPVSNKQGWNWSGEDPKAWYPLDLRFTVVVVEKGAGFSGWENYVGDEP